MTITLNGEEKPLSGPYTIQKLIIDVLELPRTTGIAVARNGRIVHSTQWSQVSVEGGDKIEILQATSGG